jgi:hypothetical protein
MQSPRRPIGILFPTLRNTQKAMFWMSEDGGATTVRVGACYRTALTSF